LDDGGSFLQYLFGYGFLFQLLAILHWAKRGGDRFWIWIIIFGGAVGSIAYFLIAGMPDWDELKRSFTGPARRRRIAVLRAMIRDNPSAGNYEQLGELLVQQKKWGEARDAFDRAIRSRSDLLDTFYWRGVCALEVGDDVAAIADLQHVVKTDPKYDYSRAQCLLARSLARGGRTEEAAAAFDRLVESSTAAESLVSAAEFYAAHGRQAAALELIETILSRRETMPSYQKRRDRAWLRAAKRLARRLRKPRGSTNEPHPPPQPQAGR